MISVLWVSLVESTFSGICWWGTLYLRVHTCFERSTSHLYTSRHVIFDESVFPSKARIPTPMSHNDQPESTQVFHPTKIVPTRSLVFVLTTGPA